MERVQVSERDAAWTIKKPQNILNHLANLKLLHGLFYKGTYYHHGVGQPHSCHERKIAPTRGR